MTHAGVSSETKEAIGINERLVRISIGIENYKDLINDIKEALSKI
jgi:cystathionine beta-lyase/cystathionine gamma-synthase